MQEFPRYIFDKYDVVLYVKSADPVHEFNDMFAIQDIENILRNRKHAGALQKMVIVDPAIEMLPRGLELLINKVITEVVDGRTAAMVAALTAAVQSREWAHLQTCVGYLRSLISSLRGPPKDAIAAIMRAENSTRITLSTIIVTRYILDPYSVKIEECIGTAPSFYTYAVEVAAGRHKLFGKFIRYPFPREFLDIPTYVAAAINMPIRVLSDDIAVEIMQNAGIDVAAANGLMNAAVSDHFNYVDNTPVREYLRLGNLWRAQIKSDIKNGSLESVFTACGVDPLRVMVRLNDTRAQLFDILVDCL